MDRLAPATPAEIHKPEKSAQGLRPGARKAKRLCRVLVGIPNLHVAPLVAGWVIPVRQKVKINRREIDTFDPVVHMVHWVENPWFEGESATSLRGSESFHSQRRSMFKKSAFQLHLEDKCKADNALVVVKPYRI